jgi:hypothetical protein
MMSPTQQIEHFTGCTYVQDMHRILTPQGTILKPDQFNATYGGYQFELDAIGKANTKKAWEAFCESQALRFPKAETTIFRPDQPQGKIISVAGSPRVNIYRPPIVDRTPGDVAPFLNLMRVMMPDEHERAITLAVMSAIVQYPGDKHQWSLLVQGCEGNGKSFILRALRYAIGQEYYHSPNANELDSKFNGWLLNKILIGIEDIYISQDRQHVMETLKPMITGDAVEIQRKGADQVTQEICCNFLLNSNHKDAIRKYQSDRRYCIIYTAQQSAEDLTRDGMDGQYFPELYAWARNGGYAHIAAYLQSYGIPAELNPALNNGGQCHRAPTTRSTEEAISIGRGSIEQAVDEAVEEGRAGFCGGYISSVALDGLLKDLRQNRISHHRRRTMLQDMGYVPHPGLGSRGRLNSPSSCPCDGGKRPVLYIKSDSIHNNAERPAAISASYASHNSGMQSTGDAATVFGGQ